MKIANIVGARPNFMKMAPIIEAMSHHPGMQSVLVHTGQHYDQNMSSSFFKDLGIPEPDIHLGIGGGTHAQQTAKIMVEYEKVLLAEKPDLTLVVGDVNSTIACALTSVKLGVPVAHVEAGLRSFDRSMPEEINRILTDAISDLLFITEEDGRRNLLREGTAEDKIHFVGNVMIDTLLKNLGKARNSTIKESLKVSAGEYGLLTLHRPSNVDDKDALRNLLEAMREISRRIRIVYPVHPRTRKRIEEFGFLDEFKELSSSTGPILMTEPLGYLDFLHLMSQARLVMTDSGGIQEETTALRIPCVTLRENTERPITTSQGSNILAGTKRDKIIEICNQILSSPEPKGRIPDLWDGKAAERIVAVISEKMETIQ